MHLCDYLQPELMMSGLECNSINTLLDKMLKSVCDQHPDLDHSKVLHRLIERETQYHTGLRSGIAAPHATIPGISAPICAVAQLRKGLDFQATDKSLVTIVFLLLSPEQAFASHVRILARIARLCSSASFIHQLQSAEDNRQLYDIICREDGRHV